METRRTTDNIVRVGLNYRWVAAAMAGATARAIERTSKKPKAKREGPGEGLSGAMREDYTAQVSSNRSARGSVLRKMPSGLESVAGQGHQPAHTYGV
jgi:hypothetical protein